MSEELKAYEAPETIYLQVDPDGLCPGEFDSLDGATWCVDQINDNDVQYIRADTIAELRKDAERGKWLIDRLYCKDACLEFDLNIYYIYCHGNPNTQDKIIAIDKVRSGE